MNKEPRISRDRQGIKGDASKELIRLFHAKPPRTQSLARNDIIFAPSRLCVRKTESKHLIHDMRSLPRLFRAHNDDRSIISEISNLIPQIANKPFRFYS